MPAEIGLFNFDVVGNTFFYRKPANGDSWREKVYFRFNGESCFPVGTKIVVGDSNLDNSAVEFEVIDSGLVGEEIFNVIAVR